MTRIKWPSTRSGRIALSAGTVLGLATLVAVLSFALSPDGSVSRDISLVDLPDPDDSPLETALVGSDHEGGSPRGTGVVRTPDPEPEIERDAPDPRPALAGTRPGPMLNVALVTDGAQPIPGIPARRGVAERESEGGRPVRGIVLRPASAAARGAEDGESDDGWDGWLEGTGVAGGFIPILDPYCKPGDRGMPLILPPNLTQPPMPGAHPSGRGSGVVQAPTVGRRGGTGAIGPAINRPGPSGGS